MTTYAPLKSMPYAQAKVRRDANRVALVSYTTTVCEIVGGVLVVHGLYSMTTRKHIGVFCREYFRYDFAFCACLCGRNDALCNQ